MSAPNSCAAHLRKTARPPSPSAGASTDAGASSRYNRLKIAGAKQPQREEPEQQHHAERARHDQQQTAQARQRPAAACGTRPAPRSGRDSSADSLLWQSARSSEPDSLIELRAGAVGRQRQEDRAVAPRFTQQAGAVLERLRLAAALGGARLAQAPISAAADLRELARRDP